MKIGVFGGTFDPIHLGHLIIAEQCREQASLDQVRFVPSARPPHKSERDISAFERRSDMIQLAIAGHPAFRVDELEKDRAGPSYTADTLAELHRANPGADLYLIIGSDCVPDLPGWHDPVRVVTQASLLVTARPGWAIWSVEQLREALKLTKDVALNMQIVSIPLIDIASRDLRRRVAEGSSIRYFVPGAVAAYIADKKMYRG
jgi:nicotinate-nucleotide adenylyltransferase